MNIRSLLLGSAAAASVLFGAAAAQAQTAPEGQSPPVGSDARSTLSPGLHDAGQAISNLTLEHSVQPPPGLNLRLGRLHLFRRRRQDEIRRRAS